MAPLLRQGLLAVLAVLLLAVASPLAAEEIDVLVEGIEGAPLQNVREALTRPAGLIVEQGSDRLWLERFRRQSEDLSRKALEPYGFYRASATAFLEEIPEGWSLRVVITPGEPTRIADREVLLLGSGSQEAHLREQLASFPLGPGEILDHQRYEEAKAALLTAARELGYPDADFSRREIRVSPDRRTAALRLSLDTGRRYFFGETLISGAPDYPEAFLRRYLAYHPGEPFSPRRLAVTQLSFVNSERFREVAVVPEWESAEEGRLPVLIRLDPGPSRALRFGIGYGTDTGARFSLRYRDLNTLDRGHEWSSNLFVSERLQGLTTAYTLPHAADLKSATSLQLQLQQTDVSTYTSRIAAFEVDRGIPLGGGQTGSAYVRFQHEAFTVGPQDARTNLILPGLRYTLNRFDHPSRPVQGYRFALELRGTHPVLGSELSAGQTITEGRFLIPLPGRHSLAGRVKAGFSLLGDPLAELPPSLRFFAGGDQSIRGYAFESLGPRNASGTVVGGKHLLVGALELERALFGDWAACLFYDVGNAFDRFSDLRLAQAAGGGIRYFTPVGALTVYLARPLDAEDPGWRFHFSVGFEW